MTQNSELSRTYDILNYLSQHPTQTNTQYKITDNLNRHNLSVRQTLLLLEKKAFAVNHKKLDLKKGRWSGHDWHTTEKGLGLLESLKGIHGVFPELFENANPRNGKLVRT